MSRDVWLASGSPRRKTLLEWAGYTPHVHPAHLDESRVAHEDPIIYARRLALEKVETAPSHVVALAADTVVHRGDRIFDKPPHRKEAKDTLTELSDGVHQVTTAVAVRHGSQIELFDCTTEVTFRSLNEAEIDAYLQTGEADDKAGAYGIQGRAAVFVSRVVGSWTNVVGLPIELCIPALDRHLAAIR